MITLASSLAGCWLLLAPSIQEAPPPAAAVQGPQMVRLATWNVENWRHHFEWWRTRGVRLETDELREQRNLLRAANDENNWQIAQVLLDPDFDPDILVFQEGPAQEEVEEFNRRWLGGAYETIRVFPSNDERGQTIGIMMKPGFVILEQESFHDIPDAEGLNPRSDHLFARGPAFVLVETPAGHRVWVGTNHQKSKGGNSVETTRWRNAEAIATHRIMRNLSVRGREGVVFLADLNDEPGIQAYELEGGGDVIENLVGPPEAGFELVTGALAETGQVSFMGYWNETFRSFIDHIVVTPELSGAVQSVAVHDTPWAQVASDHLPVYVDLKLSAE